MKNRMFVGLLAAATALVLSSSLAAAEDFAYSANAVGVIKKTIPAEKMALISVPLDITEMENDATIAFSALPFLSSFANNSSANLWDTDSQTWVSGVKSRGKWVGDITNHYLTPGQSIFFKNGDTNAVQIVVSGEVPSDSIISVDLVPAEALQACANPYPVPFEFVTSSLASNAVNNSTVNFWDVEKGEWLSGVKSRGSWSKEVREVTVAPGEGFVFKNGETASSGSSWEVTKPYVWPE